MESLQSARIRPPFRVKHGHSRTETFNSWKEICEWYHQAAPTPKLDVDGEEVSDYECDWIDE